MKAYKMFPLRHLECVPTEHRGKTRALSTTIDSDHIMAHVRNDQHKTAAGKVTSKRKIFE